MPDHAVQFLADLSKDPCRALWFQQHPEGLREAAGLAGDEEHILNWLGQDSLEIIMVPGEDDDDALVEDDDEDDDDLDEADDEEES
jgi:hypothetical protein